MSGVEAQAKLADTGGSPTPAAPEVVQFLRLQRGSKVKARGFCDSCAPQSPLGKMSADRPKRNIIKKKYDINDGMPWCEERLVRKVLFLSLREFRDTHRAAHKHSHIRAHKRSCKNTNLHALRKAQAHTQKNARTRQGSLVNGISRCRSLLSASLSWSWPLQSRPPQRRPASSHHDDPTSKRPRLQAQRKFAQSPPSSPGPPMMMSSARSNHSHNLAVVTCLTRRRPKTEDFLSFLCLRGSAALPSNMAFLASGREKEAADAQHLTSCLSTNHRTRADGRNMSSFSRAVQQDSRSLRGRPGGSAAVGSLCSLTAPAQGRRERDGREEEQQRRRRERTEEEDGKREGTERHLLRPRQLSLQVRRTNKVAMATGLPHQRTSSSSSSPSVRSVPALKPGSGVGSSSSSSRRSQRPCTRPSNTSKPRGHLQSRPQETNNNKHLSRHSNHQLPRKDHLPLHPRTVSTNFYSNPRTFSGLQNSGRNSGRTPAQMPLTNGSVIGQVNESPGVLRLSRRRRGLPPDTNTAPPTQAPLDNSSSKMCRALQCNNGDVLLDSRCHVGEIRPEKEEEDAAAAANGDKEVKEEYVSHMGNITGSHSEELRQDSCGHVGEMTPDGCISEDLQDQVDVEKLSLASLTALEPQERVNLTDVITDYDLSPVSEVMCRQVREKRLHRNQTDSSTTLKPITGPAESRTVARAATARTTVTKAAIHSVTSTDVHADPPKGTNKGTSKDVTKCTSPASSYSTHNSKGAAKDSSSNGTTEDSTKDGPPVSSYSNTSKGSTKGLTQTKSTTSAIKTRTSPRILLKR
ncbi:hypothetical protein INR49_002643 [Caranx melampygus]|nr:hypothetical protein INR49_002643 [Caranx melampygus]